MTIRPPAGEAPIPFSDESTNVSYEYYMLRVRRVAGPAGERRQVYLQAIQGGEERYFNSLRELSHYLQQPSTDSRVKHTELSAQARHSTASGR